MNDDTTKIALVGHAGVGKDLAWAMIRVMTKCKSTVVDGIYTSTLQQIEANPYWPCGCNLAYECFAKPLKAFIASTLGYNLQDLHNNAFKQKHFVEFAGSSIRNVHLDVSDELKKLYGEDFFVNSLLYRLDNCHNEALICVGDCRYPNEAMALRSRGFKLIKIVNDDVKQNISHSSEQHIDELFVDAVVMNNGKSYEQLWSALLDVMQELGINTEQDTEMLSKLKFL